MLLTHSILQNWLKGSFVCFLTNLYQQQRQSFPTTDTSAYIIFNVPHTETRHSYWTPSLFWREMRSKHTKQSSPHRNGMPQAASCIYINCLHPNCLLASTGSGTLSPHHKVFVLLVESMAPNTMYLHCLSLTQGKPLATHDLFSARS